jgi:hypothetical protein
MIRWNRGRSEYYLRLYYDHSVTDPIDKKLIFLVLSPLTHPTVPTTSNTAVPMSVKSKEAYEEGLSTVDSDELQLVKIHY